jgi:hypothetical protein
VSRWDQIVAFCAKTGIQLVFGLNGMTRTPYGSSHARLDWSLNNTAAFVKHVAAHSAAHIYAFELGNELCGHIDPSVYADDMRALRALVDAHWPSGSTRPLIAGPDCTHAAARTRHSRRDADVESCDRAPAWAGNPIGGSWVDDFISTASDVLDVFTYHNYVGCTTRAPPPALHDHHLAPSPPPRHHPLSSHAPSDSPLSSHPPP